MIPRWALASVLNNRPPPSPPPTHTHTGGFLFYLKKFLPQFSQELLGTIIEEAKERKKRSPKKKKKKKPNHSLF